MTRHHVYSFDVAGILPAVDGRAADSEYGRTVADPDKQRLQYGVLMALLPACRCCSYFNAHFLRGADQFADVLSQSVVAFVKGQSSVPAQ